MTDGAVVAAALASALLAAGCSPSATPALPGQAPAPKLSSAPPVSSVPPAPSAPVPAPLSAATATILAELTKWDAATTPARRAAAEDVGRRLADFALLRMETFSCGGQTHEVAIYSHAKTGLEFVLVPVGTFVMGSPESEPCRRDDETPHRVTLTRPFLLARTECTQRSYMMLADVNPSRAKRSDLLPVESVSWDDANAWCIQVGLALPTEAQWEWACRAGTTSQFFCGDGEDVLGEYVWHADYTDGNHEVAQKRPNAFGLYDMGGNVEQWCADYYQPRYPTEPITDPTGPAVAESRVIRGLRWRLNWSQFVRSATRGEVPPNSRNGFRGFRPARTVPMD